MATQRCEVVNHNEPARCRHCTDEQLAKRLAQGDDTAFDCLYRRYNRQISNFIRKHVSEAEYVEDIIQEVFMRVFKSIASFDTSKRFSSWVYKIALNEVKRHWKRSIKQQAYSLDTSVNNETDGRDQKDMVADTRITPDDLAVGDLFSRDLKTLIDRLPPKQRTVVILRVDNELTFEEIAEICECPLSTVLSRMRYAIQKLRNWLGVEEEEAAAAKQAGIERQAAMNAEKAASNGKKTSDNGKKD